LVNLQSGGNIWFQKSFEDMSDEQLLEVGKFLNSYLQLMEKTLKD
jgi:hypothetical protein